MTRNFSDNTTFNRRWSEMNYGREECQDTERKELASTLARLGIREDTLNLRDYLRMESRLESEMKSGNWPFGII